MLVLVVARDTQRAPRVASRRVAQAEARRAPDATRRPDGAHVSRAEGKRAFDMRRRDDRRALARDTVKRLKRPIYVETGAGYHEVATVNEARAMLGLDPVDDGDRRLTVRDAGHEEI